MQKEQNFEAEKSIWKKRINFVSMLERIYNSPYGNGVPAMFTS